MVAVEPMLSQPTVQLPGWKFKPPSVEICTCPVQPSVPGFRIWKVEPAGKHCRRTGAADDHRPLFTTSLPFTMTARPPASQSLTPLEVITWMQKFKGIGEMLGEMVGPGVVSVLVGFWVGFWVGFGVGPEVTAVGLEVVEG